MLNKDNLDKKIAEICALTAQKLDELLPQAAEFTDSRLIEAMRYSLFSGGKMIRPFILVVSADLFNVSRQSSIMAACALECIHCYSLIHDDLPMMDDDDMRRGKESCHKKYNEATAILAGNALLTFAFEILTSPDISSNPKINCQIINIIAKSSGFNGMAGGQMMDIDFASEKFSNAKIARLQRLKTGELFIASALIGATLGEAGKEPKEALKRYAHDIGLAFQIKDDINDQDNSIGLNSRPNHNMITNSSKAIENGKKRIELLKEQAINHLVIFGDNANYLKHFAEYILS